MRPTRATVPSPVGELGDLNQEGRGHGWTAVRRGGEGIGGEAIAARDAAPAGWCRGGVAGSRSFGAEPGRVQLYLYRVRLRHWHSTSLQRWVGLLCVVTGHAGRGR